MIGLVAGLASGYAITCLPWIIEYIEPELSMIKKVVLMSLMVFILALLVIILTIPKLEGAKVNKK